MFKRREEIAELLEKGLDNEEFKNELSKITTIQNGDLARIVSITEEEIQEYLNLEEDQVITNLGHSWSDRNDENIGTFGPLYEHDAEVLFVVSNAKGYKLQYFSEFIMDEEIAYDVQDNDEVYEKLMNKLGSSYDMYDEAEVILSNNSEFKVIGVYDERDEVGHITVELEMM